MNRDRVVIAPCGARAEQNAELIERARRRGFERFAGGDAPGVGTLTADYRIDAASIQPREPAGARPVPIVEVRGPADIERAAELGRAEGTVAVRWTAERVIPLENLIAQARGHFLAWAIVDRLSDVPAMLGALEHGADRLFVELHDASDLDMLESLLADATSATIPWELLPVARIAPAGIGDRVIVDTTAILGPSEGLLVGSAAAFLFHVASEAVGSRFTRPRPFRVNAGAAHSYTLLADGTTRYLAELVPGDAVLMADPTGGARSVRVGRIKIERRPLALVEIERGGRRFTVFLQDAETVRMSGRDARIATTELTAGTEVYGAAFPPARHLGGVVDEAIDER